MIRAMPSAPLAISVIVPAFREAANLRPLVERILAATRATGQEAEIIVVDDNSQDGTEEVIAGLADEFPVRLIVREQERGLSSAVLRGFAEALHDCFVVMDADLQHPPELVPELAAKLADGDTDFASGSRYTAGGEIGQDWPFLRRLASRAATLLARPLAPLSDPMSGFFALERSTWERAAGRLNPIGYKIGLELYVKARCRQVAEVPISFAARVAGESKMTFGVNAGYLWHLLHLYHFRFPWLTWGLAGVAVLLAAGLVWAGLT